jgi:hypothetical protein
MPASMHVGQMHAFYEAYGSVEEDEALKFSFWDFQRLVRNGHIICGIVEDEDVVRCLFAVELMLKPMAHISFLFWVGMINRAVVQEMLFWLWNALQHYKLGLPDPGKVGGVRIVGRKGWVRILKQMGIAITPDGYIREDQEEVRNGLIKRFV